MVANKDDVAPYFAVMFQSDKRNGSKRLMKFFKVMFQEPSVKGSTKEANISYQTPTLTAKAIYRLSDGNSYTYADTESAGLEAETAASWYASV
jgi:phi13 family phage major tail protein